MAKLYKLGYESLPHPPYSPDVAPSDYFLFADLKRLLAGKKFRAIMDQSPRQEPIFG
ncbi:Mariner transposase [Caligus rogercresseyi]|uniref:Mariner transposase n=1 Tax=Caligus rogercresseyi TaxID=217165 RepID=A0A7T8QRX4_CALRO|nr:Mariner transposase [Caligus rogercresseyi]